MFKSNKIDLESQQEIDLEFTPHNINYEDVTVVIPTLNEEEAISLVLSDVITQGYSNILVVDGGSTDRTVEIVKGLRTNVIKQRGKGKTGAIITALDHIKTPYFVLIDGDHTYGAQDIENLFNYVDHNKEVIGARTQGRDNISKFNRFGNWLINKCFNLVFGTALSDVCSGLYLLNTEFAKSIPFRTDGFDVEVEIAAYASYYGNIAETPINFHQRLGQQKLHPLRDGYKILSSIFKIGFLLHPSRVLSLFAMFLFLPGSMLLSYPFFISFFSIQLSSLLVGLIMVVIAIQGVTLYIVDTKIRNLFKKTTRI